MGHSSITVTETYLKPFSNRKIDEANQRVISFVRSGAVSYTHLIAAITLTTLQYTPQKYQAMAKHTTQDHTTTPEMCIRDR